MTDDRPRKRDLVRSLLDDDTSAIVLTQPEVLAWYLEGARVTIALGGPPIVAVRVTAVDETIFCFDNEHWRMVTEELPREIDVRSVPWFESLEAAAGVGSPATVTDRDQASALREARRTLLPFERERYRRLCVDSAMLLTDVLSEARPEHTERAVAAGLAAAVVGIGADPLVTLVAGEPRLPHRHPVPTGGVIGRRAMAVICARRHGLIANVSRWITFGEPTPLERDTEHRILDVEAAAFDATKPGRALGDVLVDIAAAYGAAGFDRDEWRRHHQGGPTGYAGRDPRAIPGGAEVVAAGQAFAWNPTAPGAKVEDTVIIDDSGVHVLSVDPRWPTVEVAGLARPLSWQH